MTVAEFATLIGVEPASARVFYRKVDAAVQRAAEFLAPVVEQMAGRLAKLVERINAATELHQPEAGEAVNPFGAPGRGLSSRAQAVLLAVENIAHKAVQYVKRVEEAPAIDGHEQLLIDRLKFHPIMARFIAYAVHHFGTQYTAERNDGRRASVIIGRLARETGSGSLAISRRAAALCALMREGHCDLAVQLGIKNTGVRLSISELKDLVDRAACRNQAACQSLVKVCGQLAPGLPSPHGRRLLRKTSIHAFLLHFLHESGVHGVYTHDAAKSGKEVDPFTLSTQRALRLRIFRPQSAVALLNSEIFSRS